MLIGDATEFWRGSMYVLSYAFRWVIACTVFVTFAIDPSLCRAAGNMSPVGYSRAWDPKGLCSLAAKNFAHARDFAHAKFTPAERMLLIAAQRGAR